MKDKIMFMNERLNDALLDLRRLIDPRGVLNFKKATL